MYPGMQLMLYSHPAWQYKAEQVERFTSFDFFSAAYYAAFETIVARVADRGR